MSVGNTGFYLIFLNYTRKRFCVCCYCVPQSLLSMDVANESIHCFVDVQQIFNEIIKFSRLYGVFFEKSLAILSCTFTYQFYRTYGLSELQNGGFIPYIRF
jgi:hypothetical protein